MFEVQGLGGKTWAKETESNERMCSISIEPQSAELTRRLRKPKSQGQGDSFRVRIQGFPGSLNHLQENAGALPVKVLGPPTTPAASRAKERPRNVLVNCCPGDAIMHWSLRTAYIFRPKLWEVTLTWPLIVYMVFNLSNKKINVSVTSLTGLSKNCED